MSKPIFHSRFLNSSFKDRKLNAAAKKKTRIKLCGNLGMSMYEGNNGLEFEESNPVCKINSSPKTRKNTNKIIAERSSIK